MALPYVADINLPRQGYEVPSKGVIQVLLLLLLLFFKL